MQKTLVFSFSFNVSTTIAPLWRHIVCNQLNYFGLKMR